MASLKDIRVKIDTTKNTQQITKAMKLVSAAKLRKAQNQIVNMRPYGSALMRIIADIATTQRVSHPLLNAALNEPKKILLVVLTSDRGLAGAFNTNVSKFAEAYHRENKGRLDRLDFLFIGRKGADYFARRGMKAVDMITRLDKDISYQLASGVADRLVKNYLEGDYDEVRLVYNEFKSAISQQVTSERLLPVDISTQTFNAAQATTTFAKDMIFEPSPEVMIDQLLLKHFAVQVYRCMCESVAAEHGARMTSMENATNNAKEVLNRLTLTYNKARQEKITTELVEIVSGAEAV